MSKLKSGLTIGIPIYNEESHLSDCLDSCVDQKAVILISDNGSTDGTGPICKSFISRHPTAQVFFHPTNRGSLWNFGYLLEQCDTEYFMWLGGHDRLAGDFGNLATRALQNHPEAAFCFPRYQYLSSGGQAVGGGMDWETVSTDPHPWHRFRRFLQVVHRCTLIHSVFRTQLLRNAWEATCSGLGETPGPDILLLAWLLPRGPGTFEGSLKYCRRLAQNPDAGDYQKKMYAAGRKKNLSPKDTGRQLIRIAESCPLLTWRQKKATIYLVVQKWGRPRGWHPLHLGIYFFSQIKKSALPRLRHLNNRLFWRPSKKRDKLPPRHSSLGAGPDWIGRFMDPAGPKTFGKIGTTELLALEYHYRLLASPWGWKRPARRLYFDSGVFPATSAEMKTFVRIYEEAITQLDGICLWQAGGFLREVELRLSERLNPRADRISVRELSFAFVLSLPPCRWLVVSSFVGTMKRQLPQLADIHPGYPVSPEVVRSCQFVEAPPFPWHRSPTEPTWSQQLKDLKKRVLQESFDLAVVGAGAYSLPLLAAIKSAGRKAIHLGGETQLLFGIKGRRWDAMNLYNEHWVRPSREETPSNYLEKENGCYW